MQLMLPHDEEESVTNLALYLLPWDFCALTVKPSLNGKVDGLGELIAVTLYDLKHFLGEAHIGLHKDQDAVLIKTNVSLVQLLFNIGQTTSGAGIDDGRSIDCALILPSLQEF
jgi:hypothetical protein